MSQVAIGFVFAVLLFAGMLVCLEWGWRLGVKQKAADPGEATAGTGAVEGALFALLGLLIAFTFSGAASRFDARRALITSETNALGTAWLRLDLLPPSAQPAVRDLFRRYVDARLEGYQSWGDDASAAAFSRATELQGELWANAVTAARAPDAAPATTSLVLGALSEMFDVATSRAIAVRVHPPTVIYVMLFGFALVCAVLAGFGMAGRTRKRLHSVAFAVAIAVVFYVTLDLDYPRHGLVRVDAFDDALVELRKSMR